MKAKQFFGGIISVSLSFLLVVSSACGSKSTRASQGVQAVSVVDFLNSMGVVSSVSRRGENLQETINNLKYTGLRWVRVGYEDDAPVGDFIRLYEETGVRSSYGLLSGGTDIQRLIRDARQLAQAGALLAIEGANEPNNWEIIYNGRQGGGSSSWLPVAELHRDLYIAVKKDSILKDYSVWATCETGAQTDNCGLQFLVVPEGANALMPAGTQYADYANCHNYVSHPSWKGLHDNQTWLSASPGKDCPVDGLYGNFGCTWRKKFLGYSDEDLKALPRVTTETGYALNEAEGVDEETQARLYLNLYLSQFKRGWSFTAMYLLKGRKNEPAHESFAFFKLDNSPKQAAHYMHNFTTILSDDKPLSKLECLDYTIENKPITTHDLLLQKSNGDFMLVLWGEHFGNDAVDNVKVEFRERVERVAIYDPTVSSEPIGEISNASFVELALTDHPVVLNIR